MNWLQPAKRNVVQGQIINISTYYTKKNSVCNSKTTKHGVSENPLYPINLKYAELLLMKHIKHGYFILTNIFSSECFASQQFKNTGINKFLIGGHNSWNRKIEPLHKLMSVSRNITKWRLIIQWLKSIPWFRVCEYSTQERST